jgi:uncharacterized membrane protein
MLSSIRVKLSYPTLALLWVALAFNAEAHRTAEQIAGVVAVVSESAVTIRTVKGRSVDAIFDSMTRYVRGDETISRSQIKTGDRVVMRVRFVNRQLLAERVQVTTGAIDPRR